MKQKITNRILSILNILGWVAYMFIDYYENLTKATVEIEWTKLAVINQQRVAVTLSEILFVILLSINIFFLIQNFRNKKTIPWYIVTVIFYFIATLSCFFSDIFERTAVLWRFIPIIPFVIALIIELVKKRRKKNIILYSVGLAVAIILAIINKYNNLIWLVIASIFQFIFSLTYAGESKSKKILNTIILGIVVVIMLYDAFNFVTMTQNLYNVEEQSKEFFEEIEKGLENEQISTKLIRVARDGKWGYINQDGEEVIPCEYELLSNNATTHSFVLGKKDNIYYVIAKNGKVVATNDNIPAPFYRGTIFKIDDASEVNKDIMMKSAVDRIATYATEQKDEDEKQENQEKNVRKADKYENNIYKYNLENGNIVEVEEVESHSEKRYNVKVKSGDEVLNNYENVKLLMDPKKDGDLQTYTSGDIPYYNLKTNIQGYYDKATFEDVSLKGRYQILDIINDKIIIRNYNNVYSTTETIISKSGENLLTAKQINATENGFIIKKSNNKMVYLDNGLNPKIDEVDFISDYYLPEGRLIYIDANKYYLCDLEGNVLTKQKYEKMDTEKSFTNGATKEYLLDKEYKEFYDAN